MHFDVRYASQGETLELFVTAVSENNPDVPVAAQEIFDSICSLLQKTDSSIFMERVFAPRGIVQSVLSARSAAYEPIDDGICPSLLTTSDDATDCKVMVQIHAVSNGSGKMSRVANGACGVRVLESAENRYVSITGILPALNESPSDGVASMFEKADSLLSDLGCSLRNVARTWFWLGDILDWYGDFNKVRNDFFVKHDLLGGAHSDALLPASTGIGIYPVDGQASALDLVAIVGQNASIARQPAAGNQNSAYRYGSAFSRSSTIKSPAGDTLFVSGTASIAASGETEYVDESLKQVLATVRNVQAVLNDGGCSDKDVVQAIAYCKTPEVMQAWNAVRPSLPWPVISMIADVCRPDLLFEIEAMAVHGAQRRVDFGSDNS